LAFLKCEFLRWLAQIDSVSARRATVICANSLYSCENIYRSYGVYPRLNYLGVDAECFRPLNRRRDAAVLSVGALHPSKAQDFVVESVGTLDERPSIRFIYNLSYGATSYQSRIVQLAERLGVSVSFENLVTDDKLVEAYNQALLTVFPSRLEPFGFVPLESMACGTPVVGVAEGGIRETVQHGETGLLTERDPREFGQAIATLLNDSALRAEMGSSGRSHVLAHWTWDQSCQKLEKHMQMALERMYPSSGLSDD